MCIKQVGVSHDSISDDTDDEDNAGNGPLIQDLDQLSSRVQHSCWSHIQSMRTHPHRPLIVDTAEAVNA